MNLKNANVIYQLKYSDNTGILTLYMGKNACSCFMDKERLCNSNCSAFILDKKYISDEEIRIQLHLKCLINKQFSFTELII